MWCFNAPMDLKVLLHSLLQYTDAEAKSMHWKHCSTKKRCQLHSIVSLLWAWSPKWANLGLVVKYTHMVLVVIRAGEYAQYVRDEVCGVGWSSMVTTVLLTTYWQRRHTNSITLSSIALDHALGLHRHFSPSTSTSTCASSTYTCTSSGGL